MLDNATKDKFICLRAKGRSLDRIAEELGIAKGTAFKWDSKFQQQIQQFRVMELEAIRERVLAGYEQELSYLADELKRVQGELRGRDYGYVNTDQLYWYQSALFSRIDKKCPPLSAPSAELDDESAEPSPEVTNCGDEVSRGQSDQN